MVKEFSCVRNNAGDYEENYNFIISCVLYVYSPQVNRIISRHGTSDM